MDDQEFQEFLDAAQDELELKQKELMDAFGLGSLARWFFDQERQTLQFFDSRDQLAVEAEVINIGSFSTSSSAWKWAWANETVVPTLRQRAEPLKALAEITGLEIFRKAEAFEIDEAMAWELMAISVRHLGAKGCYQAPSPNEPLVIALALMEIRRVAA